MEERRDFEEKEERVRQEIPEPVEVGSGPLQSSPKIAESQSRGGGKRNISVLIIALAFVSAIVGGLVATYLVPYMYGSSPAAVFSGGSGISGNGATEIIAVDKGAVSPVTAVAKKLQSSIVNINIRQSIEESFHPDVVSGVGSGVIYREDGYILTNNHVILGAKDIFVTVGTDEIKGTLVAADTETDLAVIKVNRKGLPAAEFGSTKDLQVGEIAVAIGSPFGFEHTVTSGIISALNRTVSIPDSRGDEVTTYTNLIQTDAPINPGNSGGALSDAKGRVIGINTLIMSSSGVTEGVGFAIPSETVQNVADQLIEKGQASHPYMGIKGSNIDDVLVDTSKLAVSDGAIVLDVLKGTPAEKAGLKKNDVITAIDGKKIKTMDQLLVEIRQKKVGDKIELTYYRGSEKKTVELTLVEKLKR
ncbi:MAG: trypsin-like peptidase domain-containing protein [Actinomycetota bacterium]|nr:trypsin-like peptidase domain-containing protein [Actinomycetota bacterium]